MGKYVCTSTSQVPELTRLILLNTVTNKDNKVKIGIMESIPEAKAETSRVTTNGKQSVQNSAHKTPNG